MLEELVITPRDELIRRCRATVALRSIPDECGAIFTVDLPRRVLPAFAAS